MLKTLKKCCCSDQHTLKTLLGFGCHSECVETLHMLKAWTNSVKTVDHRSLWKGTNDMILCIDHVLCELLCLSTASETCISVL